MEMKYGSLTGSTGSAETMKAPAARLRGPGTWATAGKKWKGHIAAPKSARPPAGWPSTMPLPDGMRAWSGTGSRGHGKTRGPGKRSGAFGTPLVPARRRSSPGFRRDHAAKRMVFALALVLALGCPAEAGFADGVAAYDRGDYASAFREFREAAGHDDATAKAVLGHMYATGQGVARNMASAVKWYRQAAEQGVVSAQNTLAQLYAGGRGVAPDYVRAHKWFAVAVRHYPPGVSRDNALRDRGRMAKMLSPDELERARRMAKAWLAGHPRRGADETPGGGSS